jgi:hypothetical protein
MRPGTTNDQVQTAHSPEDQVCETLVAYGAPLADWAPHPWLPLEEALPLALRLARTNATLLRVLPLVLARNASTLDGLRLLERTRDAGQEAEMGFLLELSAELTGHANLAQLASSLEGARQGPPRYFFAPRSERDRRLVELGTAPVARRWGLLLNMPEDSFRSLLAKHDAPVHR